MDGKLLKTTGPAIVWPVPRKPTQISSRKLHSNEINCFKSIAVETYKLPFPNNKVQFYFPLGRKEGTQI